MLHTVVETPSFISAAKSAGMTDEVRGRVVTAVGDDLELGDLIEGSGGFRKFRFARPGGGKSGGFRVVSYFHSLAMPVFLITVFAKNQQANLTRKERNDLARLSAILVETYKAKEKSR